MTLTSVRLHSAMARFRRLARQDSTFRLIDAYTPRVFGLFFQAYLITQFGVAAYALPGWALGVLGVILTVLPDPHSYIIVRGAGARSRRLHALSTLSIILKVLLASIIVLVMLATTASEGLYEPHGVSWIWVSCAALFYGGTEFLWAVLGTISLANFQVRRVAIWGLGVRIISMTLLVLAFASGEVGIAGNLALASFPVFITWLLLSPITLRWRRVSLFYIFSVLRYSGWLQGISFVTVAMLQMPSIFLGLWPNTDPAMVGAISFCNRILLAAFQPFQILQSVVIRDASHARLSGRKAERTSLWPIFKFGGLLFGLASLVGFGASWRFGYISYSTFTLGVAMGLGIASSVWYRYELSEALGTQGARPVLVRGYLPSLGLTLLASTILMYMFGTVGLAASVLFGWIALSLSWKWTPNEGCI